MARKYSKEQRERAVRMAMDRLDGSTTPYQVAADLGPKLGIGKESLRRWIIQAQVDAGQTQGRRPRSVWRCGSCDGNCEKRKKLLKC